MRVLLLSPVPHLDPMCGDVTYTMELLADPPDGVEYVTYDQALRDGTLTELGRRDSWQKSVTGGVVLAQQAAANYLRRHAVLFREPFRHFRLVDGAYDLVHAHVFSARISGSGTPLLVSNAAPIENIYGLSEGWSAGRVARARRVDTALAAMTGVQHSSYRLTRVQRLVCFTEWLRDWYVENGITDSGKIDVVPCSVRMPTRGRSRQDVVTIGFIGGWRIKGGDVALKAFRRIREVHPDARLVVCGQDEMPDEARDEPGVVWLGRVSREKLLEEIAPTFDVFLYPSRADGLPLTLLEVMSLGVPVVTSDFGAMPEILRDGGGIAISGEDDRAFATSALELLRPDRNAAAGAAARERVLQRYSKAATNADLLSSYRKAIAASA